MTTSRLAEGINRLVDVSPGPHDLVAHGLQFFAARRWRALGLPVPRELVEAELQHAFVQHASPSVLARVREACDGPLLLVKGPAAAELYGDPTVRPYQDLDLVVANPRRLQDALVARGFVEIGEPPPGLHHLRTLLVPELPLKLEVHGRVKWVRGLEPPTFERLVRSAVPLAAVEGVSTLRAEEHAALLAVHVWSHDPLTRLLRLVDVALAAGAARPDRLQRVLREWRLEKLWGVTARVIDAVFHERESLPLSVRLWSGGLREAREAAVWESYLGRLLGPLVVLPPAIGARASLDEISWLLKPETGESARTRLSRILSHLRAAGTRRNQARRRDAVGRSTR